MYFDLEIKQGKYLFIHSCIHFLFLLLRMKWWVGNVA